MIRKKTLLTLLTFFYFSLTLGSGIALADLICHDPGTPEEMTLVVKQSSLNEHLGHGDYQGYCLFESHVHTSPDFKVPGDTNGNGHTWDELIFGLESAGLSRAVLFGPVDSLRDAKEANPQTIFPFVALPRYPSQEGDSNSYKVIISNSPVDLLGNKNSVDYIKEQLDTGLFYGIGEMPLRHHAYGPNPNGDHNPVDSDVMLAIYDLAAQYAVPVNVHVEDDYPISYNDELERALAHNRDTRFIWAHAGFASPAIVGGMMERNINLYADLSNRNRLYYAKDPVRTEQVALTNADGTIKEEWRQLLEAFPDRFVFGTDVGSSPAKWGLLNQTTADFQAVLAQLTPATAVKIANRNMKRLLGFVDNAFPLEAFLFRDAHAQVHQLVDAVAANASFTGTRSWRFSLTNHAKYISFSNATITVDSDLAPSSFPNVTAFPITAGPVTLFPEGLQDNSIVERRLEQSDVPVVFTPGFASSREMINGDGTSTVTIKVTPIDARYDFPDAEIGVNLQGNVVSIVSPGLSNGESLDPPEYGAEGARWLIHGVKLNTEYTFTAVLQGQTLMPAVQIGMTSHDEAEPVNRQTFSKSIEVLEPTLDGESPGSGRIAYGIAEEAKGTFAVQKDFYVHYNMGKPWIPIEIDVKPGSWPNSINLNGNGVVPVGVFGSNELDVTTIDVATVKCGALGTVQATPVHSGHITDLNGDGIADMVFHFREGELGIPLDTPDNTTLPLVLLAKLNTQPIKRVKGEDIIRITPNLDSSSRGKGGKGPK